MRLLVCFHSFQLRKTPHFARAACRIRLRRMRQAAAKPPPYAPVRFRGRARAAQLPKGGVNEGVICHKEIESRGGSRRWASLADLRSKSAASSHQEAAALSANLPKITEVAGRTRCILHKAECSGSAAVAAPCKGFAKRNLWRAPRRANFGEPARRASPWLCHGEAGGGYRRPTACFPLFGKQARRASFCYASPL